MTMPHNTMMEAFSVGVGVGIVLGFITLFLLTRHIDHE